MVIAVIAILAAILIPSITAVRQSANETKSKSNLREWHRAAMLYANENDNRLPLPRDSSATGNPHWNAVLGAYLGYDLDEEAPWLGRTDTIGTSPNHESDHKHGPDYISYGMNLSLAETEDGKSLFSTEGPVEPTHLSQIHPDTVLFADSPDNWFVVPSKEDLGFRYRGKAFAVMVGGSIEEFDEEEPIDEYEHLFNPDR